MAHLELSKDEEAVSDNEATTLLCFSIEGLTKTIEAVTSTNGKTFVTKVSVVTATEGTGYLLVFDFKFEAFSVPKIGNAVKAQLL